MCVAVQQLSSILKEQKAKVHRAAKLTNIFLAASIALATTACNNTGGGVGGSAAGSADGVAATVNGKPITLKEVDTILAQQAKSQHTDMSQMSPLEIATARLQVVGNLIKQEVLFQRADKDKLTPTDDEITLEINQEMQQNGMTQEGFQKMLKDNEQTEPEHREVARKQIAIRKLLDRVTSKIGTPSDKEVEDFYNNNKQRYVSARGVGLATIVVDPQDNGATDDAKNDAEAKIKIDIIYQRLNSGADFAAVAREKSEDPQSSLRGGDLGFITEDQLKQGGFPPELIAKFFNTMQSGNFTPPFKTPDGRWTIFKLTGKRLQNENLTFDNAEVKKDATDNIINQRQQILNAAFIEVAMDDAKIVNNLASKMLDSPNNLSGLRPAQSPGSAATPAASPATSPNASPAASGSPKAATSTTTSVPQASPKKP